MDPVLFCAVCVFMRFNASQQLTELSISITNFVRTIDPLQSNCNATIKYGDVCHTGTTLETGSIVSVLNKVNTRLKTWGLKQNNCWKTA